MPTWPQAIKEISSHLGVSDENLDFLRIPQYYFNARGKKEYTQLMRKVFRHADFLQKHEIHDKIIEFNTHTIITTNYDNLIEKAAEDNSEVIFVVSKDADLPYRKGGKELIKIHGDFDNDNFVLKEDDYLSYSRNFRLIENYVKSLIGTNVILFLGYSFSDPDIKQIFSWAKDILEGDFQRAYLIESGKEYDANEADYYKNLGINVLYASLQLNRDFKENDLTSNLLNMLKWLLLEDKPAKLDALYDDLKPFQSMNFASDRYVRTAFGKVGLIIEDGNLAEYDPTKEINESGKIIRNLAYEQYTKSYLANKDNEESKEETEKRKHVYDLIKDFEPEKHNLEKIKTILDILEKSGVNHIVLYTPTENGIGWHLDSIDLANHDFPVWFEAINNFDYYTLKDIVNENNAHLSEARPELYTEQGYLNYILKEYLASYNCFKIAASIYYRHREYIKYFIAEFNRYYVGKIVINSEGIIGGINHKDVKTVKEEISAVDLERTYQSLPNLGGNNNVLKDIYTFNIVYTLFQDAYLASEKVKEQANSNYVIFSGMTAFSSMRKSMIDYYNYIVLNQLAVDNTYIEYKQIFRIYFQSILGSVMTPNKELSSPIQKNRVGNIHADRLNSFDLMIALKYEDFKNLQKLLQNVSTNLPLEEGAIDYLLTVIEKYKKRSVKRVFWCLIDNVFWKAILFLGHCELRSDLVDKTLTKINECIIPDDYRQYGNAIIRFFNNSERQGLITDCNINYIESFLSEELKYLCNDIAEAKASIHDNLVLQTAWMCQKYTHLYEEKEIISRLISSGAGVICAKMYPFIGESCKKVIFEAYENWKLTSKNLDFDFYCILVESKILNPDNEAEQTIFSYLNNREQEHEAKEKAIIMFPEQNDTQLIFNLVELYLKGLIIDTESLIGIIKDQKIESALWLMDYKNYNYELFEINWIKLCTAGLLKEISGVYSVRKNISEKFTEAYNSGQVDQSLLDVYFRYFSNAYDEDSAKKDVV